MACVRKEVTIQADADTVWAAVRDVGQVHQRLVPGVLVDARLEGDERVVSFANGLVVRERIVDIDDAQRRLAYAAVGGRTSHHNASVQILDEGEGQARLVWVTDFLPNDMAGPIGALVEAGAKVMKQTLEAGTVGAP